MTFSPCFQPAPSAGANRNLTVTAAVGLKATDQTSPVIALVVIPA